MQTVKKVGRIIPRIMPPKHTSNHTSHATRFADTGVFGNSNVYLEQPSLTLFWGLDSWGSDQGFCCKDFFKDC